MRKRIGRSDNSLRWNKSKTRWMACAFLATHGFVAGVAHAHSMGAPNDPPASVSQITLSPKSIQTLVTTNATGGATLTGGKVRIVLVQNGVGYYCGDAALVPKGTGPQSQPVTVSVPLPSMFHRPATGSCLVQRYVSASFSDGTRVVQSNVNVSSKACVPFAAGALGRYAAPPKSRKR